jgi:nitroreductase
MELMAAIKERRSIRRFRPDPVPRELLAKLLGEALWAPSAMNTQPWRFFMATGTKRDELVAIAGRCIERLDTRLKSLFKESMRTLVHGFFKDLGGAPAVVVALAKVPETEGYMDGSYQSASAAFYNFLLLAHEAGLGTCWMTGPLWVEDELLAFLGHRDGWRLLALTPVGWPDQTPPVPPRKHQDIVWLE